MDNTTGLHGVVSNRNLKYAKAAPRLAPSGTVQERTPPRQPVAAGHFGWVMLVGAGGGITLPADTLDRISAMPGIHKALAIPHPAEADRVGWLRGPHAALPFAGQPPLALNAGGTTDGLLSVRRFLDASRGGLFMAPNGYDREAAPLTDADIVFV